MRSGIVLRGLSAVTLIIALSMLAPLAVALIDGQPDHALSFLWPILAVGGLSTGILALTWRQQGEIQPRTGFFLVSMGWILASAVGALPFVLGGAIPSYTDAFFETMSGFSTTGASILTEIESMPRAFLFWRSLTHWLGGMGIVVLAVALFPLLGIGGLQLMRAEAPGPDVDRITNRIAGTAKILWALYLGMTLVQTILLRLGGMSLFDSLTHTFGTLATGGFSTRNASVGAFESLYLQNVITLFMVMAGMNFIMHYRLLTGRFSQLAKNSELKAYLLIFLIFSLMVTLDLERRGSYATLSESISHAGFQTASILTTTGFATADYAFWPGFSQALLFVLMFVGGSAGSTGGGIKVVRIVALIKQGITEMKYLIHPRSVSTVSINGAVMRKSAFYTIAGFVMLYLFFILLTTLVVAFEGHDLLTSLTTALATLGNIGPGFGLVGPSGNYAFFSPGLKWFLSFIMMLGRLEIYTVLVLFSPAYWKR